MNLPSKLKFKLNKELDKWTCNSRLFYNANLEDYPDFASGKNLETEDKEAFNNAFVENFYDKHEKELSNAVEIMNVDWLKIEHEYFKATDKLFKEVQFGGVYTCYPSIFNRNPRFIDTKEFQAFYKHSSTTNYVCAHEILHFMFYDYIQGNFKQECGRVGEEGIWKLSEIFNDVVLRLPEFLSITKQANPAINPAETEQELADAAKLWNETKTINAFITKYLASLN